MDSAAYRLHGSRHHLYQNRYLPANWTEAAAIPAHHFAAVAPQNHQADPAVAAAVAPAVTAVHVRVDASDAATQNTLLVPCHRESENCGRQEPLPLSSLRVK